MHSYFDLNQILKRKIVNQEMVNTSLATFSNAKGIFGKGSSLGAGGLKRIPQFQIRIKFFIKNIILRREREWTELTN